MNSSTLKTLAFLLVGTNLAYAAPAEVAGVIHADKPFGQGSYRFLAITAYKAELWQDAPQWSMDAPFALTLRYGMGFSSDDIASRAQDEMKHVDPSLTPEALKIYQAAMIKVFPPVKSGDEITALYQPGQPVHFFKNGTATGDVGDAGFAKPFFGIWLSPQSSSASLRRDLLNLKTNGESPESAATPAQTTPPPSATPH